MIVMKFGGSSVGEPARIQSVREIVQSRLDRKPVVVVSAHKGVTDMLVDLAESATETEPDLQPITERHQDILGGLGLPLDLVDPFLEELSFLLKGVSLVKELTPRTMDYVLSFGERMSSRVVAAYFREQGLDAQAYDAFDIGMKTDDVFGAATPLASASSEIKTALSNLDHVAVVTGYIGKNEAGDITTLGRNGSDFTASFIGAAMDAEEIQIWTDVDGVMTADPRLIEEARPVDQMSFGEAAELAYYGGRVLHPATIIPAMAKHIPVRVLNTFRPEEPGTVIVPEDDITTEGQIKSIASQESQIIINITSSRMFLRHGFMAKVFEVFGRHEVVVNMIATSEVSVSVTTHTDRNLDKAVEDLSHFADVTVERDRSIICVVGQGLRSTPGIAADIFKAVAGTGVNVLMISHGASSINLAFVVEDEHAASIIRALHDMYFTAHPVS
jgi:aspartate kinase